MSGKPSKLTLWLAALAGAGALVTAVVLATTRNDPPASTQQTESTRTTPAPSRDPQTTEQPTEPERTAPSPSGDQPPQPTEQPVTPPAQPPPAEQPISEHAHKTMPEKTGPSEPARSTTPPRRPPFDEPAARAVLQKNAAKLRACKADSTFRQVETTVRLTGTITVAPRGRATLSIPPGYDITPCLERVIAGLRFQPSDTGGSFEYTFLL